MPLERERQVIEATQGLPATAQSLANDLRDLGVEPGMPLIVHSSLSSLGWVVGGAQAVVMALAQAVGEEGTLLMPTQTGGLSEPSVWQNPPVPEAWWPIIREHMPAFDPGLTPTRGMGAIVETFRTWPGTLRSAHPQLSFAARGKLAGALLAGQTLNDGLGERSPLARLYDHDGWVLLLGVGHDNNTSIHLAEYRAHYPGKEQREYAAPVMIDGRREWTTYLDIQFVTDDFPAIGDAFAQATGLVAHGKVGQAQALLMPQRELVDYAVMWMGLHRGIHTDLMGEGTE
ncbi:aminoglycoside N(3)-acetyltransferase [Paenibacillus chartarius]|uniref:Aminoglycoside N(3)-acetyltransferase n=1 Tax=Paenibacillus chartarius TaxID=747481 RepID=A0ABV6DEY1_9BACL